MSDVLLRHWQMLSLVPRAPRKVDPATLQDQLESRGFHVTRRSIQRDLIKLSMTFGLISDERSKPFGWSWARDAKPLDVPGMDLHTALAFNLAAEHLAHLLPQPTFDYLQPHFRRAREVLDSAEHNDLANWRECIRVLPRGLPMAAPAVDTAVLETIHDGLLHRRQLEIRYCPRGQQEPRAYIANPLGLVYRDKVAYLVCALYNYDNVVQLAVHRMSAAVATGEVGRQLKGFSLDGYIEAGEFGYRVGDTPICLHIQLRSLAAVRVTETPLAPDQTLVISATGDVELRATVADTAQLRVWLRGHGPLCEVLGPAALRREIGGELRAAAALYAGDGVD